MPEISVKDRFDFVPKFIIIDKYSTTISTKQVTNSSAMGGYSVQAYPTSPLFINLANIQTQQFVGYGLVAIYGMMGGSGTYFINPIEFSNNNNTVTWYAPSYSVQSPPETYAYLLQFNDLNIRYSYFAIG